MSLLPLMRATVLNHDGGAVLDEDTATLLFEAGVAELPEHTKAMVALLETGKVRADVAARHCLGGPADLAAAFCAAAPADQIVEIVAAETRATVRKQIAATRGLPGHVYDTIAGTSYTVDLELLLNSTVPASAARLALANVWTSTSRSGKRNRAFTDRITTPEMADALFDVTMDHDWTGLLDWAKAWTLMLDPGRLGRIVDEALPAAISAGNAKAAVVLIGYVVGSPYAHGGLLRQLDSYREAEFRRDLEVNWRTQLGKHWRTLSERAGADSPLDLLESGGIDAICQKADRFTGPLADMLADRLSFRDLCLVAAHSSELNKAMRKRVTTIDELVDASIAVRVMSWVPQHLIAELKELPTGKLLEILDYVDNGELPVPELSPQKRESTRRVIFTGLLKWREVPADEALLSRCTWDLLKAPSSKFTAASAVQWLLARCDGDVDRLTTILTVVEDRDELPFAEAVALGERLT